MNATPRPIATATLLAGLIAFSSASASADMTKDQCIDANGKAQVLRRDGKFAAAREQLRSCADPSCPAMVRDDCNKRIDDLEAAQPSVVFDVKDAAGSDIIDVRVSVDGQKMTDRLEGTPLQVDPGPHTFTFEVTGHPTVTRQMLVKEGDARRREHVVIADTGVSAPPAPAPPIETIGPPSSPADSVAPSSALGTQRIIALTLGGIGIAGLGVGTVFGLLSGSAWSTAKSVCGGNPGQCANVSSAQSYRSTAETDATVSTAGFIGGGALLAAGAILFFTASPQQTSSTTGIRAIPTVGLGQAGVAVNGVFP